MFRKVLIANRGEIAIRVMKACRELGIATVAVYSDPDRAAHHVRTADEAVRIGPAPASQSYLNIAAIIDAALATGAEAIHPGYGFLSENAEFAHACIDAGIAFIGPSPDAMRGMASKIEAKRLASSLGVPLLTGYDGENQDAAALAQAASAIGYPVLIKASAGGGGRGMRIVHEETSFAEQLEGAKREALGAFGDDRVLLEHYVTEGRHIEVQVFGDQFGTIVSLGDRDCSIQRRHQKVIEEAPAPGISPELRAELSAAAIRLAGAIHYCGAGTVEFLVDEQGRPAFLEMNTRLQVEHGVTELVTGLDLVQLQLRVAAGEPIPFRQDEVHLAGHAIECRVYAEDPDAGFRPSTGTLARFEPPTGAGIRNDVGFAPGDAVTPFYDSMLGKLLVWAEDRTTAIDRTIDALHRYEVRGVATNVSMLGEAARHPVFRAGAASTRFLESHVLPTTEPPPAHVLAVAAVLASRPVDRLLWSGRWRLAGTARAITLAGASGAAQVGVSRSAGREWRAEVEGRRLDLTERSVAGGIAQFDVDGQRCEAEAGDRSIDVRWDKRRWRFAAAPPPDPSHRTGHSGHSVASQIAAPLAGTIAKVAIAEGEEVEAGQTLVILEAMKMEHLIVSPRDGVVAALNARAGDLVPSGAILVELHPA